MVYMCVICTEQTPPLVVLTPEHRNTLEALISSSVDLTPLKRISLLLACSGCVRQLQSLAVFQSTVLKGVRHMLTFLHLGQTQNEGAPDPLSLPIKVEPEDPLLNISSYVPMEIELPMVKPEEIKPEPASEPEAPERPASEAPAPQDIEDNIPLTTVIRPEVFANTCHTLTNTQATPVSSNDAKVATFTHGPIKLSTRQEAQANAEAFQMQQKLNEPPLRLVLPFNIVPVQFSFAPVQNQLVQPPPPQQPRLATEPAAKMATFSHRPAAGPSDTSLPDNTGQPTSSKLLSLLLLNRTDSETNSAASAKDSVRVAGVTSEGGVVTGTHTNKPEQNEPKSTYFIYNLKDSEITGEREAARSAPEFAEATHKCERCFVVFACEREKEIHDRDVHSSTGAYLCGTCGHPESCLAAFQTHTARHSVRYCCVHCPFRAPDEAAAKEHTCDPKLIKGKRPVIHKGLVKKPRHKVVSPFRCKECSVAFADEEKLERHMKRVHSAPSGPLICKICNRECKDAEAFYQHTLLHERSEKQRSVDTINLDHMMTLKHSGCELWQFQCDTCGRRFPSQPCVEAHARTAHLKLEPYKNRAAHAPPPARCAPAHVCRICARAFTTARTLREHMLSHERPLRPLKCPLCPSTFSHSGALRAHHQTKHLKVKGKRKKAKKKTEEKSA